MRKIFKLAAFLCSVLLIGGCANMTQNNEIKTTLEKAFNTAQGNDLFEVGKQVLDTYAPKEESIYLINTYSKGTTKERNPEAIPKIYIVIKLEKNKKELKASLFQSEIGTTKLIKIKDLIYRAKGNYYTVDGSLYEPLYNVSLFYENKDIISFDSFRNQKFSKNNGNVYSSAFYDINFPSTILDKIDSLFLSKGPEKIIEEQGGISFWNHGAKGDTKQDFELSTTIHSVEKNITLSADLTLTLHEDFVIN